MPPPSVSPPTPVVEMMPDGVARPCSPVAASTSAHVQPPPTRTVSVAASTTTSFMPLRSMTTAVVDDAEAAAVVAAAAHRDARVVGAGEGDRARDVLRARAAHDQRRVPVDHAVVDGAGLVVAGVAGTDDASASRRARCAASRAKRWTIALLGGGGGVLTGATLRPAAAALS